MAYSVSASNYYFLLPSIILTEMKFLVFKIILFFEEIRICILTFSEFKSLSKLSTNISHETIWLINSLRIKYYSNFIFLRVQSDEPDLNYFYQKAIDDNESTKTFIHFFSYYTNTLSSVLYPHIFYERFYSKIPTNSVYTLHQLKKRYVYYTGNLPWEFLLMFS